MIMTDQQRYDLMGCVNSAVITPSIDALAAQGNLFTAAYSSTPSSTPARAGLLTGSSPWQHGMLGYGKQAAHYKHAMPRMMKGGGYWTVGVGKMHFAPQQNTHGFDVMLTDESGRIESPFFMSDYRKWFNTVAAGQNPDATAIDWNSHEASVYKLTEELHPTRWTGDVAVEIIESYSGDEPIFLKVSFARPHSPYDPPQRVLDMYEGRDIPAPAIGEWVPQAWREKTTDNSPGKTSPIGAFGDEYAMNSRRHYYAATTFIDEQVGRIVEALKQRGMYDNSLIVFISDHGDMMGDHNLWRKTYAYEGSAAIPFIVKMPKTEPRVVAAGVPITEPVELRDVLPTFLDIAGIEQPAEMDGKSVLPLIQSSSPEWREFIDMEHSTCYWDTNYWMALANDHYKYIWNRATGEEQLFDLHQDESEINDLSQSSEYRTTLLKMRAAMVKHLEIRGEKWVKDGELVVSKAATVYNENFPEKR